MFQQLPQGYTERRVVMAMVTLTKYVSITAAVH
ncbi:hypothetical protein T10_3399 [Trichinella papuae]|uniref:Uncharacterized protein n=1 Tax=Trichinella papuae TaxID=268474 RepID=A0A0V1LWA2_9BILA|nr:hypothetical protein T10_10718 [Trichinella papuae]KRZ63786.1 hypothetical protein T10_3399 [Trichinella papuae]